MGEVTVTMIGSLFIFLGCVHITVQAGRFQYDQGQQFLRQDKYGRRQGLFRGQQQSDTDYVTQEDFKKLNETLESQINKLYLQLQKLEKQEDELEDSVENDVTKDQFHNDINILSWQITNMSVKFQDTDKRLGQVESALQEDHCKSNPCLNGGICRNNVVDHTCTCKPGFEGLDCGQDVGPVVSSTLFVDNGNTEGTWNLWAMCPTGSFVRKFHIKLEDDQGSYGDDSAMNNVEMTCHSAITGEDVGEIKSGSGPFGTWRGWQGFPTGEYLIGFMLKVEGDQGTTGDDSAVNGITMRSEGGTQKTGISGTEGSFGSMVECPHNHYICGVSTRIEQDQGGQDDSGLNDVMMKCCVWF